jgi:hypothetical protein
MIPPTTFINFPASGVSRSPWRQSYCPQGLPELSSMSATIAQIPQFDPITERVCGHWHADNAASLAPGTVFQSPVHAEQTPTAAHTAGQSRARRWSAIPRRVVRMEPRSATAETHATLAQKARRQVTHYLAISAYLYGVTAGGKLTTIRARGRSVAYFDSDASILEVR